MVKIFNKRIGLLSPKSSKEHSVSHTIWFIRKIKREAAAVEREKMTTPDPDIHLRIESKNLIFTANNNSLVYISR